jgi:hypothetical protein
MNKYLICAICLCSLLGCRKLYEKVDEVDVNVSTEYITYKVGQTVDFIFEGTSDFITFYSGEKGREYAYKDKDRIIQTEMSMSFSTTTSSGTSGYPNPASVPISYSTDFSGEYTVDAINKATWIDITNKFDIPTDTGISKYSGELNITNLFNDPKKPIYLMFHYKVNKYNETLYGGKGNGRTQWNFGSLKINGIADGVSQVMYDIISGGWQIVLDPSFEGATSLPDISSSRILLRSEYRPSQDRECWAVSGPITKMDFINNGPDYGLGIKSVSDATLKKYSYVYKEPGEYTVTFVAANANVYDRKEVVRQIKINVIEDSGSIESPERIPWN